MKRKIIYMLIFSVTSALLSCTKTEDLKYNDQDIVNIWLGVNTSRPDSLEYNYAFKSLNETDSVLFTAKLTGKLVNHDRVFYLKAIGGDTTRFVKGKHYNFGKYVIKANSYQSVLPIYIKKSADFKSKSARIVFSVSEEGELKKGLTEMSKLVLVFRDEFAKPSNWDADTYPYNRLFMYFGAYSNTKFQFITTVIKQAPIFRVLSTGTSVGLGEITTTEATFYRNSCRQELAFYNAAHLADPLKDENNQLITFP